MEPAFRWWGMYACLKDFGYTLSGTQKAKLACTPWAANRRWSFLSKPCEHWVIFTSHLLQRLPKLSLGVFSVVLFVLFCSVFSGWLNGICHYLPFPSARGSPYSQGVRDALLISGSSQKSLDSYLMPWPFTILPWHLYFAEAESW